MEASDFKAMGYTLIGLVVVTSAYLFYTLGQ